MNKEITCFWALKKTKSTCFSCLRLSVTLLIVNNAEISLWEKIELILWWIATVPRLKGTVPFICTDLTRAGALLNLRAIWKCHLGLSYLFIEGRFRAWKKWLSQNKAVTCSLLSLINHQWLLIKLISQPEIELLITMGMLENQMFKRRGKNRHMAFFLLFFSFKEMVGMWLSLWTDDNMIVECLFFHRQTHLSSLSCREAEKRKMVTHSLSSCYYILVRTSHWTNYIAITPTVTH